MRSVSAVLTAAFSGLFAWTACTLFVACSAETDGDVWLDIEHLAFVPAARCLIVDVDCSTTVPLVVDRYEVTRMQWLQAEREQPERFALPRAFTDAWGPNNQRLPATGMTLDEARAFAALRGMRLPTVREWMRIASGPRVKAWPGRNQKSSANTSELMQTHPSPVGTFENGKTFNTGVFDLLGNVWEWADGPRPLRSRAGGNGNNDVVPSSIAAFPRGEGSGAQAGFPQEHWAMGGSYLYPRTRLWGIGPSYDLTFVAQSLEPEHRAVDLGFRRVADARSYLWEHAPDWDRQELRERLIAIGRSESWSGYAVDLLKELTLRPDAPRSLSWLLEGASS